MPAVDREQVEIGRSMSLAFQLCCVNEESESELCVDFANTWLQVFQYSRLDTVSCFIASYWSSNVISPFVATVLYCFKLASL